ncbi:MAG: PilC/PilY family type IV pilus protein, partial [Pseudomonadota bacterium]
FLLDNSGSMHFNSNRLTAPDDYSSGGSYTGSWASGFYYWTTDGSIPTDPLTDNKVAIANFQCNTGVTPLANNGIYTDKILAWHVGSTAAESVWSDIAGFSFGAEDIDCETDEGAHGNGGSGVYPANGTIGPWTATAGNGIDWDDATFYYTFYTAHYLNYNDNPPTSNRKRYDVMVNVVDRLLRQVSNVNIGLMWFRNNSQGGFVDNAVVDIDNWTDRQALLTKVNTTQPQTGTPLSETLYEAFQYYSGGQVSYGDWDGSAGFTSTNESVNDARVAPALTNYKSPIEFECQKNFILMLTDGEPWHDSSSNTAIPNLPDFATRAGTSSCDNDGYGANGRCLEQMSAYMNYPDTGLAPSVDGPHSVQTYTVGFQIDNALLLETSEGTDPNDDTDGGGGQHYVANNSEELANAFTEILNNVTGAPTTFTAPSVSVNAFNRTLNREFLYYTMFLPDEVPRWDGNLKKYKLVFNTDGTAFITDNSGTVPAPNVVDPNSGEFVSNAKSYWNTITDGNDVEKGGVRARLSDGNLATREVWTYTGTNTTLSDTSNAVSEGNAAITTTMLGIASTSLRSDILKWIRGVDVLDEDDDTSTTDSRKTVGDPLHSQPKVVTYDGDASNPVQVIFFATNDGYLHAIDEATGNEIFSYIPQEMLPVQATLYANTASTTRPYGLDGSVTTWTYDHNGDGIINPVEDHVYLYVGMRRGGNNYYALDVTNVKQTTPSAKLLWKIVNGDLIAGSAGASTTGLYSMMGQTWSQPLIRTIKIGSTEKVILAVGGGYDTIQDTVSVRTADTVGRAVYFINAETGAREWWGSSDSNADLVLADMQYSIPTRLAGYDITGDGYLDRLYFGDMGAQIWRMDIDNGQAVSTLVTGGVIADLGGTGTLAADARRFYHPPDAALAVEASGAYLSLAIGSGYRAHPLDDDITDRLYMVKDEDIYTIPSSYTKLTESDLYDATDNFVGEGTAAQQATAAAALASANGWYITLGDVGPGEKSLSAPLILGGVAIMTTFTPTTANACNPDGGGKGAVYYLNLANATPVYNFNGVGDDNNLTKTDRYQTLSATGIPPETAYIVGLDADGNVATAVLHGKEQGQDPGNNEPTKTYWYEQ